MISTITSEQRLFLENTTHLTRRDQTQAFNERFSENKSVNSIKLYCNRNGIHTGRSGHFLKGGRSINKGKKMGPCAHAKPIGYEVVGPEGYILIKTSKGWVFKSRYIWEQHNGDIPKDHQIIFKNGNSKDTRIENLLMVKRKVLLHANRFYSQVRNSENGEIIYLLSELRLKELELSNESK